MINKNINNKKQTKEQDFDMLFDMIDVIPKCASRDAQDSSYTKIGCREKDLVIEDCDFDKHGGLFDAMRVCGRVDIDGYLLDHWINGKRVNTILSRKYEQKFGINPQKNEIKDIKKDMKEMIEDYEKLTKKMNQEIVNINGKINNLNNQITNNQFDSKLSQLTQLYNDLSSEKNNIRKEINHLNDQFKALNITFTDATKLSTDIVDIIQDNTKSINELREENKKLKAEIHEISFLTDQFDLLQRIICSSFNEIKLQGKIKDAYNVLCGFDDEL